MSTSASRVATFGTTIFTEINILAQQYGALNLGQGKPDFDTPPDVIERVVQALQSGQHNQYPPGIGVPSLQSEVSHLGKRYSTARTLRLAYFPRLPSSHGGHP